ncbi:kinase-like domain-containing protein [Cristinia sonorae]|uniref:Kinase-like domain-containing protein n=1 Tax=Cristinia sonorae TaxID=1940300 RepID=A0A8K0XUM5_9AGAR|nr:kinase-like domain-containing protein [Cristinia sonorae]
MAQNSSAPTASPYMVSLIDNDPRLAGIPPDVRQEILEAGETGDPDGLELEEVFWRDHQPWLEQKGYRLRPRYKPDWIPSWKADGGNELGREDACPSMYPQVMDATRLSDGEMVLLKSVKHSWHPYEIEITKMFSEEPLRSHPQNHCVPVFEVLASPRDPDISLLVLPLLRQHEDPPFETLGEVIEFFRQVFEGLQFMHQCHVAHRDCMFLNVMMDPRPMYPKMYHPASTFMSRDWKGIASYYSRTFRPVKYYLIDFGISRKYDPSVTSPLEYPILGGDKTVPEFLKSDQACNPFPTDVYYIGNLIRTRFLEIYPKLDFVVPLISDMVQDDPSKRPTMDDVVARFDKLYNALPTSTLRYRFSLDGERGVAWSIYKAVVNTIYRLTGRKALPRPPKHPLHTFSS